MSAESIVRDCNTTIVEKRMLRLLEDYEERIQKLEEWKDSREEALEYERRNK